MSSLVKNELRIWSRVWSFPEPLEQCAALNTVTHYAFMVRALKISIHSSADTQRRNLGRIITGWLLSCVALQEEAAEGTIISVHLV